IFATRKKNSKNISPRSRVRATRAQADRRPDECVPINKKFRSEMVSVGCASTIGTRPRAGRFSTGLEGWAGGHRRRPLFHWERVLPPPRIGVLGEGFLQVVEDLLAVLALYVRHVMALDHPGEALVPAVAR